MEYRIENLRNIGFMGHGATGKTSLVESLIYYTGGLSRLGNIEDGTTVSDFDQEEKKRKISLSVSIATLNYENIKINLVDIPGYFDFEGEVIQGMRAVDVANIVVCGVSGVQVGTEKAWEYCNKIKLPRTFFVNKLDRENSNFDKVLSALKSNFGISVVPIQYPIGKEDNFKGVINIISQNAMIFNPNTKKMDLAEIPEDLLDKVKECRQMIMEAVAETDEELLEKYFEEGELSDKEIYDGLIKGCASGEIAPVMCGSATSVIGMGCMLEDIIECFPSPKLAIPQKAKILDSNNIEYINLDEKRPFSAIVFKTIADPFVGKISIFKVITGKVEGEMTVLNSTRNSTEKLSHIFFLNGKNQVQTNKIIAGDIAAVAKLQNTATGDTLCDSSMRIIYDEFKLPETVMSMAVIPKSKGDEDKISAALQKLSEEDPVFKISRDIENAETIISGIGETHLEVIASRLKSKFGVDVDIKEPKIPYRETIKGMIEVQGKHKKQSGGHGQYGDVKIKFEPRNDAVEELEFVDKIVGGVVPRNYIPAVEKGLRECIIKGVLAGYPVIGLKATLFDGSYHTVDSSEMAFKIAASLAYKNGLEKARPTILEPIMHVEITVPDEYMGDIIGDVNKKRGRVLGMELEGKLQKIICEVPMSEMFRYATELRSITQARGTFIKSFARYEEVPPGEIDKIIEYAKKIKEEKEE